MTTKSFVKTLLQRKQQERYRNENSNKTYPVVRLDNKMNSEAIFYGCKSSILS